MDDHYAGQPEQPDHKGKRQLRIVRLSQNNQRQLAPETMQRHDRDVSDEEYDEGAKSQEMQTPCALPSVKSFDIYHDVPAPELIGIDARFGCHSTPLRLARRAFAPFRGSQNLWRKNNTERISVRLYLFPSRPAR